MAAGLRSRLIPVLLAALLAAMAACAGAPPPAPPTLSSTAESLAAQGSQMFRRGCLPVAEGYFRQALEAARLVDNVPAMVRANNNLAAVALAAGDLKAAEARLDRAVYLSRSAPSNALASLILGNLGSLAYERGNLQEAERIWRQALARAQADPLRTGLVLHQTNLGMLARKAGRLDEAAALLKQAGAAGGVRRAGYWLQLGLLAQARGEMPSAEEYLTRALAMDKRAMYPAGIAQDLASLGSLAVAAGRAEKGLRLMDRSIRLWAELGRADKAVRVLEIMQKAAKGGGLKFDAKPYGKLVTGSRRGPSPLLCR